MNGQLRLCEDLFFLVDKCKRKAVTFPCIYLSMSMMQRIAGVVQDIQDAGYSPNRERLLLETLEGITIISIIIANVFVLIIIIFLLILLLLLLSLLLLRPLTLPHIITVAPPALEKKQLNPNPSTPRALIPDSSALSP